MAFEGIVGYLRALNLTSLVLRFLMAAVFGGLIGATRGRGQHAAGLRTHMLVCLGSACVVMVGEFYSKNLGGGGDAMRLPAQVISGIGFLGAGSIIVTGKNHVSGLTTAAGLWATACMGIACGAGYYECAAVMFLLIYVSLVLLHRLDTTLVKNVKMLTVFIELRGDARMSTLLSGLSDLGVEIRSIEPFGRAGADYISYKADVEIMDNKLEYDDVVGLIGSVEGVTFVEELKA